MNAKGVMDVYRGRRLFITIANHGGVDVDLPNHQKLGDVASARKNSSI